MNDAAAFKNRDADKSAYFELVREQLQFWPYTIHQIDDTLDAGLIEARAKQLLFRAIHSRNLTAFVGSGLSMSYGRLDWRNWEKEQTRTVRRKTELFDTLCESSLAWLSFLIALLDPKLRNAEASDSENLSENAMWEALHPDPAGRSHEPALVQQHKHNVWQWLRGRERAVQAARNRVKRLSVTFELIRHDAGHFPGGEEMPVKFEVAQQLYSELGDRASLFIPPDMDGVPIGVGQLFSVSWAGARSAERGDAPVSGLKAYRKFLLRNRRAMKASRPDIEDKATAYLDALKAFWLLNQRPEAKLDFETLSKTLLVDECPHAAILLRRGLLKHEDRDELEPAKDQQLSRLEHDLGVFDQGNQRRDIKGIREDPMRYRVLTPFLFDRAQVLIDRARQDQDGANTLWAPFLDDLNIRMNRYLERTADGDISRQYLTPSSRYLTALALSLIDDPYGALGVDGKGGRVPALPPKRDEHGVHEDADAQKVGELDPGHPLGPPTADRFSGRRSILAERFDPMPKIHGDLKVTRYITTNYDFEIERYFQDLGFRSFDEPPKTRAGYRDPNWPTDSDMRSDEMGRVLRDRSFTPEEASRLTSFAMASGESGADVMHLHGRSTKRDGLVITERDYMRLYLTDDRHRPTIDEGIQIAFSGAPLLFLGLGMEETDLLRPLRQFISNRDRTIGYTSIALLPAEKPLAARTKFSASLYMRYGVHTVFYGSGQLPYQGLKTVEGDPKHFPLDWLHRIIQLCGGLRDELKLWEGKANSSRSPEMILRDLIVKVGFLGADLEDQDSPNDYPEKGSALLVLLDWAQLRDGNQELIDFKDDDNLDRLRFLAAVLADGARHPAVDETPFLGLRNCDFAPTRPSKHRKTHETDARTRIDGASFVGFYTQQLDRLLTMVLRLPQDLKSKSEKERKAHCCPIHIALDGLQGAFITGTLNAALEAINQEKRAWWFSWQASPNHRLAEFQRLLPADEKDGETGGETGGEDTAAKPPKEDPVILKTVFLRHKLDNVMTPLVQAQSIDSIDNELMEKDSGDDPDAARLSLRNRTKVRSFDTFVAAVASTFKHRQPDVAAHPDVQPFNLCFSIIANREERRRQLITVAARRGMGKGTFMSAFCTPLGQNVYRRAAWPSNHVFFAGSIHINLGFSPEIASTYDMLARALIGLSISLELNIESRPCAKTFDDYDKRHKQLTEDIKRLSRHAALEDLFARFRDQAVQYRAEHRRQPRLLLNICAAELLFDAQGQSKNREINRFIDLLFGKDLHDCPIDIVFVADDAKLGSLWGRPVGEGVYPRRYLNRQGLDLFAQEQIKRAMDSSKITMDESAVESLARLEQPTDISTFPDYQDDAAWTKANTSPNSDWPESHFIHFTRPVNTAWLLIDNFPTLAVALHLLNPPRDVEFVGLDHVRERFEARVVEARKLSDAVMGELWSSKDLPTVDDMAKARAIVAIFARAVADEAILDHTKKHAGSDPEKLEKYEKGSLDSALRYRLYRKINKTDSEQWRQIRQGLGNSRFSLTLLLAAAENLVVHAECPMSGAKGAQHLLLDTVARVRTVGHERRDQLVFETALEVYRGMHQIGDPDLDCDLHLLIVKHLGVIGTPVGSAVLVRLSGIREYFSRIGIETDISRRRFIVRALTTMAHRGLVFRLDPHPRLVALSKADDKKDWPAGQEYRYALHRVVQSFALTALEAGPQEPVAMNRFSPTLYASMPSQGPTLSRKSYRFLRSLIIGLSQYPDVPASEESAEPWLFTTNVLEVKVQAARAAVSLARSNFSVAVVSRLAIHEPIGQGVQTRGYLEIYRVRLRWLIRIAYDLAQQTGSDLTEDRGVEGPHIQVNVLYRDEIVWLYNELGVIALAQGALSDALGYLRQAAEANEGIEGLSRSAPIYNHIDLNHAIVQLERGQFASARSRLQTVKQANKQDKCRLYRLAKAYECVLDHLQGRPTGLSKRYQKVTEIFERDKEDRAAAIFLLHRARFLTRSKSGAVEAVGLVERARTLAHAAGHEDIRHQADLIAICVRLRLHGPAGFSLNDQRVLHNIEEFSRRMSIWSLSVETLHVRAQILLSQNENMAAGRHLIRAMAIAKRHDMNLRLNSLMTTYARVLLLRGDKGGAAQMAEQSLERAKSCGYALETSRAQDVLRDCEIGLEQDVEPRWSKD